MATNKISQDMQKKVSELEEAIASCRAESCTRAQERESATQNNTRVLKSITRKKVAAEEPRRTRRKLKDGIGLER